VVNVHPHREHFAIENLERQEYETYCPMMRKRVRHARKTKDVLRPLFPGYVFVRFISDQQRWRPILSTYGVRTLVRFGDQLSFIDDGFIGALRRREVEGAIVKPETPYQVGQSVKLTTGGFDGVVAQIINIDEKNRLTVLLDLLGRIVKVKVAADGVRDSA
jgi:transcriptional antiterminator RfaH